MNEIIERINNLEKRLAKLEGKTLKVKTLKRKTPKVKNPKKKTLKRKSPKPLHDIDSIK
jgi:hypothetical protein